MHAPVQPGVYLRVGRLQLHQLHGQSRVLHDDIDGLHGTSRLFGQRSGQARVILLRRFHHEVQPAQDVIDLNAGHDDDDQSAGKA